MSEIREMLLRYMTEEEIEESRKWAEELVEQIKEMIERNPHHKAADDGNAR